MDVSEEQRVAQNEEGVPCGFPGCDQLSLAICHSECQSLSAHAPLATCHAYLPPRIHRLEVDDFARGVTRASDLKAASLDHGFATRVRALIARTFDRSQISIPRTLRAFIGTLLYIEGDVYGSPQDDETPSNGPIRRSDPEPSATPCGAAQADQSDVNADARIRELESQVTDLQAANTREVERRCQAEERARIAEIDDNDTSARRLDVHLRALEQLIKVARS